MAKKANSVTTTLKSSKFAAARLQTKSHLKLASSILILYEEELSDSRLNVASYADLDTKEKAELRRECQNLPQLYHLQGLPATTAEDH